MSLRVRLLASAALAALAVAVAILFNALWKSGAPN